MFNVTNKVLALSLIGMLFPVHTQGMDQFSQGEESGDDSSMFFSPKKFEVLSAGNSACVKIAEEPDISLPKSYRALQTSFEHLLYEFCNPTLDEPGSRLQEESKKNKEYSQKSAKEQTQRAFSAQKNSNLKDQLGYEIEEWLVRRDKEYVTYKAASTEFQKREGLLQKFQARSNTAQVQRNEIRLRNAQQNLNAIFAQLVWMHAPSEVVRGEREVTAEEIASIKQRIYSKERPSIIIKPRAFYSSALPVGTPYFKDPNAPKVQGFILGPRELPCAYEELKKLVEALEREHKICQSVSEYYNETFLPKVKGWALWQMGNWMALSETIATAQTEIKELIEKKYPFLHLPRKYARDLTTDKGEVLAYLNKDERGQHIRTRLFEVNRSFIEHSDQNHKMSQADHFFARIYHGEDEWEANRALEGCHIDAKYPHQNPVRVHFEKIKTRKHIRDEERYRIRLMLEPTPDDYPLLHPNELALLLKGDQLYGKEINKDEVRIDVLTAEQIKVFWALKHILSQATFPADVFRMHVLFYCWSHDIVPIQKDIYERLQKAVQENKGLTPKDRRAFLNHMLLKKYIFRTREIWAMPKETQMVEEYPSLQHVFSHKRRWNVIGEEVRKKHNPIETDSCSTSPSELTNGYNIITSYEDLYDSLSLPTLNHPTYTRQKLIDYNALYKTYERLLGDHVKLLREMNQPYGSYTYIPKAIEFFISEAYVEKPSVLPFTPPQEITLSNVSIRDDDLQKKRLTQSGCEYVLYYYLTVDLSRNFLTGKANYHFSKNITALNLSHNQITSLEFLSYLSALKILNLSDNMLSDLSDFSRCATTEDRGGLLLQELDLSNNEIEDVGALSVLKVLRKLDVSGNKIKTLSNLYHADTTSSSYDIVQPKEGKPQIVTKPMSKQIHMSLLTSLKANKNALGENWKAAFPEGLNHLATLEIKGNKDLKIPDKPFGFFDIFPALKTLKTDAGDEDNMSKEPVLIDLRFRSIEDQNITIKDRILKIGGEGENIMEESHSLFYFMWLNLSNNLLNGASLKEGNFFSNYIVKLEICQNKLGSVAFIKGLRNLTYLDVSQNQIKDPSPIKECSSLTYLDISTNPIPNLKYLNNFTSLKVLKANNNGFEGDWEKIFPEGLENLEIMEMSGSEKVVFAGCKEQLSIRFPALKQLETNESILTRNEGQGGTEEK